MILNALNGRLTQRPVLGDDLQQWERHGEQAENEIRHGQVCDVHVSFGAHFRFFDQGCQHHNVAERRADDQYGVGENENEQRRVVYVSVEPHLFDFAGEHFVEQRCVVHCEEKEKQKELVETQRLEWFKTERLWKRLWRGREGYQN